MTPKEFADVVTAKVAAQPRDTTPMDPMARRAEFKKLEEKLGSKPR